MSERKVLNKYYPPDFDPSKIPRMKLAKNRQYTVRLMAPFNMRCATCGEYIYKGKKFNARKEDVENEDYLGIRIYRFYIKCTRCLQEISFKTDPKNTDYEIEAGATRNFMALKLAEEQAKKEDDEKKEEEANNPMKLLEIRTEQSKQEIELLESLEELKELNRRQRNIDYEGMLKQYQPETTEERKAREQKEDDDFIKSAFGTTSTSTNPSTQRIIAEEIVEEIDETHDEPPTKTLKLDHPQPKTTVKKNESWNKSIGALKKPALNSLVKAKKPEGSSLVKLKSTVTTEKISDQKNPSADDQKSIDGEKNPGIGDKKSVPINTSCIGAVTTLKDEKSDQKYLSTDNKKSVPSTNCTATVSGVVSEVTENSKVGGSGLSLLAGYSGSDSDGSD